MSKLSLRELVFVLLLFGIIVGQWQLVLTPRTKQRKELAEDVAEKQQQLNELEQARTLARQNLDDDIARLNVKIEALHELLPSQDRRHGIIEKELKSRADAHGLVTLESRMSEPVPSDAGPKNDNITEGEFFMRLRGNYVSFFSFLEAIERMDYIVKVDRIVLARMAGQGGARGRGGETDDDEDGNVSVELQLTFYFSD